MSNSDDKAPKKLARDAAQRRIINWYLVNHLIAIRPEIEKAELSLKELARDLTATLELFAEQNQMVNTGLEIHPATLAQILRFLRIHYRGERGAANEEDGKAKAAREEDRQKLATLEKAVADLKRSLA